MDVNVDKIKDLSIVDYLEGRGINVNKIGRFMYCRSPFTLERTPSFCIYPTNTFYDWSSGIGGDIIRLVQEMDNVGFMHAVRMLIDGEFEEVEYREYEEDEEEFRLKEYICEDKYLNREIRRYAFDRGIYRNFSCCNYKISYVDRIKKKTIQYSRPSMGFVHVDEDFSICGVKMRNIKPYKGCRFSGRGKQRFYIITNQERFNKNRPLYIVESESSSNSLLEFLSICKEEVTIVSFGSWNNIRNELPGDLEKAKDKRVIIDYDGNEDLYQQKIEKFNHFDANEIKLSLDKGVDINSLFLNGSIFKYKNKII